MCHRGRGAGDGEESLNTLPRRISVWSTAAILIGSTIGSGIFRVPSVTAAETGSVGAIALLWITGAALTLFGALTVAELAAMIPRSGGIYVFIREAWGEMPAFVFGWTRLLVIQPALLGGIALIFAAYVQAFLPLSDAQVRVIAAGVILLLAAANYRSMVWGVAIQNVSTVAKVLALVGLAVAVFALGDGSGGSLAGSPGTATLTWAGFGTALIAVLWAYDGWADATYVAGEVKDPGRALPRALIGGFLTVVLVYLLLNAAYLYALPLDAMASSELVAADTATTILGPAGSSLVAALVLLSTFGALNGTIMSGPRVFYAMGTDRLFFRYFGALHPKGRTPHRAIALAAVLGVGFVSVRTFEELAEAFILGLWPFFMLAVLAVFRLRRRDPERPRPYRTLGYPVVPAIFLLVSAAILLNALVSQPLSTLFSFGVIALGIPVYYGWRRITPG